MNAPLKFAVIGHPIAHSLSPRMHTANFQVLGLAATYEAFDIEPADIPQALARFQAEGYLGINVTVPHKIAVKNAMTRLDVSAVRARAVNTVRFESDGTTTGFNTDMAGFRQPLDARGFPFAQARVVLLGAGGAARAVAAACLDAGCRNLVVANRTVEKAAALVSELAAEGVAACSLDELLATASERLCPDAASPLLLVNATTVGLKLDDPSVLPPDVFQPGQLVYDLIPVARETATRAAARAAGAETLDGLGMLAAQAAESFCIWTGQSANLAAMRASLGG